jgi:hypothetical protein
MDAMTREAGLENMRDATAAKLEMLRNRGTRVMGVVPSFTVFPTIMSSLLKEKQPGTATRFKEDMIDEMSKAQLIVALNVALTRNPKAIPVIQRQMGSIVDASQLSLKTLASAVKQVSERLSLDIPITNVSDVNPVLRSELFRKEFNAFRNANSAELDDMIRQASSIREITVAELAAFPQGEPFQGGDGLGGRMGTNEAVPLPRGGSDADPNRPTTGGRAPVPRQTRSIRRSGLFRPRNTIPTVQPSGGGGAGSTVGSGDVPLTVSSTTGVRVQDYPIPGTGDIRFVGSGRTFNKYSKVGHSLGDKQEASFITPNADGVLVPVGYEGVASSKMKFFNLLNKNKEMAEIANSRKNAELNRQQIEGKYAGLRAIGQARDTRAMAEMNEAKQVRDTMSGLLSAVSQAVSVDRPGMNQPVAVWKAWAVKNKIAEPHTLKSLKERFS